MTSVNSCFSCRQMRFAQNRSRIRHRVHGLGTSRQYERGVNFGHAAGLIDRIVDYSGVFKNTEPAGCWVVQPSL